MLSRGSRRCGARSSGSRCPCHALALRLDVWLISKLVGVKWPSIVGARRRALLVALDGALDAAAGHRHVLGRCSRDSPLPVKKPAFGGAPVRRQAVPTVVGGGAGGLIPAACSDAHPATSVELPLAGLSAMPPPAAGRAPPSLVGRRFRFRRRAAGRQQVRRM